jgi:hypothetical protein
MGDGVTDARSALVLDPDGGPYSPASCRHLLAPGDAASRETVAVTYECGPAYWVDEYCEHVGAVPDDLAVVTIAASTRSAASRETGARADPMGVEVRVVEEPDDLSGVAIAMDASFERWRSEGVGFDHRCVCFDSVTNLLEHVDLETAFRLVHVIQHRAAQVGAATHFHLSPHAHDDRTVATVRSLFEAVHEP